MVVSTTLSRRAFIERTATLLVSLSFSFAGSACSNENRMIGEVEIRDGKILLDLEKKSFQSLRRIGHGISITIDQRNKPILVTRIGEKEVAALSAQCSHAGYTVLPPEGGILICSSGHGGRYALDGQVLHGPPKSPLRRYPSRLEGNLIIIDFAG